MTQDRQHDCPDSETLGAFLDGSLREEQAIALAAHISNCDDCLFLAGEATAFREDETPVASLPMTASNVIAVSAPSLAARRPRAWRKAWVAVAAIAAVAVIGVPLLTMVFVDPMHALVSAAPTRSRTLAPRLTGGFRWAPFSRLRGGGDPDNPIDPEKYKLEGTAGQVLEEAANRPSPTRQHAAGVADLLIDEPGKAIEKLLAATTAEPGNARYWSDLGAAYYAASERDDDATADLTRARSALEKAVALDPKLDEAQFNLALTLQRMGARDQAIEAWKRYLVLDPDSKWANEAKDRHLRELTSP